MIYTDASSAETIWSDAFSKYPLWLADYSERDEFPPDITVWESWTGFQYSNTGTVPGISGNVDLNKFRDGILISLSDSDSSSEKDNTVEYMVRPGDTLWQIARRYETTVPAITALNGIADPDRSISVRSFLDPGNAKMIPQRKKAHTGTLRCGSFLFCR